MVCGCSPWMAQLAQPVPGKQSKQCTTYRSCSISDYLLSSWHMHTIRPTLPCVRSRALRNSFQSDLLICVIGSSLARHSPPPALNSLEYYKSQNV